MWLGMGMGAFYEAHSRLEPWLSASSPLRSSIWTTQLAMHATGVGLMPCHMLASRLLGGSALQCNNVNAFGHQPPLSALPFFGVVQVLAAGGVWRDVGRLPESALAQQIRHDEIDILVELTGRQGMRLTVGDTQHPVLPKSACACWPCLTRHRGKDGMVAP